MPRHTPKERKKLKTPAKVTPKKGGK